MRSREAPLDDLVAVGERLAGLHAHAAHMRVDGARSLIPRTLTTCSTRCARWLTRFAGQAVTFTYLFGSHARGTARPNSDVDIAVHLDEAVPPAAHLDLGRGLAGELAYRSGVGPIDGVVVFNEARLGLVGRVLADRRVIYSADERVVEILHSRLDDFDQFRAAMARTVGGP